MRNSLYEEHSPKIVACFDVNVQVAEVRIRRLPQSAEDVPRRRLFPHDVEEQHLTSLWRTTNAKESRLTVLELLVPVRTGLFALVFAFVWGQQFHLGVTAPHRHAGVRWARPG
jgi:hypothetical protein